MLKFREDGTFHILQVTDIHFQEDDDTDHRTLALMRQIIAEEKPDLIISTGDTVYGPANLEHIGPALVPLTESGIPWTLVFGNHDTEEGLPYEELMPVIRKLPGSLFTDDRAAGHGFGNHILNVADDTGKTVWTLTMVDSGNYYPDKNIGGYAAVNRTQVNWYIDRIHEQEKLTPDFGDLVFMHIAVPEYNEVWDNETCYGSKNEEVCCPKINTGFFAAMLEGGHTRGCFVGHDHINDYYGDLYGITLAYGRATGYHTYGQEGFLHGARNIIISKDDTKNFSTSVRLSDHRLLTRQEEHKPGSI